MTLGLIFILIFFGSSFTSCVTTPEPSTALNRQFNLEIESRSKTDAQLYLIGNKDAPHKVIEYIDYECPFCRLYYPKLKSLINTYKTEVSLEIRHFPLSSRCNEYISRDFHPGSCELAGHGHCAAKKNLFSKHLDFVFTSFSYDVVQASKNWLLNNGYKKAELEDCLKNNTTQTHIAKDIKSAGKYDLDFTPAIFIDGRIFRAELNEHNFEVYLRAARGEEVSIADLDDKNKNSYSGCQPSFDDAKPDAEDLRDMTRLGDCDSEETNRLIK